MPHDDGLLAELVLKKGWVHADRLRRAAEARRAAGWPIHPLLDFLLEDGLLSAEQAEELRAELAARGAPLPTPSAPSAPVEEQAHSPGEADMLLPAHPARRTGWRRTLTTAAWVAVCAAVVAVLVALVSRSRPRRPSRPQPARTSDASPAPPKSKPSGPPSPPDRPATAAEEKARRLAEAALAFDREHREAHAQALLQLRRALLATRRTPLESRVRGRLRARHEALARAARGALRTLDARLAELEEAGRLAEGLRACAAFPQELRVGPWAAALDARVARAAHAADRRYVHLLTQGAQALASREFDAAARHYERLSALGIPWMAEVGEALAPIVERYTEEEQARFQRLAAAHARLSRRRTFAQLADHVARIYDHIEHRRYQKALARVAAIPDGLREGDAGAAVVRLERRVALLLKLWRATLAGPAAAQGKPFRVHGVKGVIQGFSGPEDDRRLAVRIATGSGHRVVSQRIASLSPLELAQLGRWALAGEPPGESALAVALFLLAEGQHEAAAQALDEAQKHEADVAPYRRELEAAAVATKALAAHKKERWAEARPLLERAVDEHADAPPVLLRYGALLRALHRCLRELGEPVAPQPLRPRPLPVELRLIPLLPETQVLSTPPDDPLATHLGTPLQRSSPLLLGHESWSDYHVSLDYTQERGSGFLLLLRLGEPQPGRFTGYALAVDGSRLSLTCRDGRGERRLDAEQVPELAVPRRHRLVISLIGESIRVMADERRRVLGCMDRGAPAGRIGLVLGDGELRVHQLSVLFPTDRESEASRSPRRGATDDPEL